MQSNVAPISIRAIVFDFDGVIVESEDIKTSAFRQLFFDFGEDVAQKIVDYHLANLGISRYTKFRYGIESVLGRKLTPEYERELGERFSLLVEDAVVTCPWVNGAKEFILAYYEKIPLYIASGTPDAELKRIISRREITHCFRSICGTPRNKTQILSDIVEDGAWNPAEILMVGDAMADYEGASNVGLPFIGRVAEGAKNVFPSSIRVIPDLQSLSSFINIPD